jgi:two-component system CheB/CheR fusion protein
MKPKPAAEKNRRIVAEEEDANRTGRTDDLLIVAIGASAGGLEAFVELLRNLPTNTGMAFIYIQHLDPTHHSILTELLAKETSMKVKEVTEGMEVEADHVFVIPPNTSMSIANRILHLVPRGDVRGVHMSVDHLMRSLAEDQRNSAIGVILSGTGSDGTLGMAEIQAQGGVTFAQDESSAKYDGMPRSAIAAGAVDYVLTAKGIARELARIAHHPYVSRSARRAGADLAVDQNAGLKAIFQMLRRTIGVDFTHYRQTTILRRIQRRMLVHKIDELNEYVRYLQLNPGEIGFLYKDMLINVTGFFRNPRVFDGLKSLVFPKLMEQKGADTTIRIWTPACASGEEPYSVAMALLEYLEDQTDHLSIQIFGTDISEASIDRARLGVYPENIQGDVSSERLRRFFTKSEGRYRISKSVRDLCVFAQHNLVSDPPFSQMDLICCRNLLIYLELILQNKVISLFHYAIRPGGYLVLGSSEGIGTATNLFTAEDRSSKIFSRKTTVARQVVTFSLRRQLDQQDELPSRLPAKPETGWTYLEAQKEFDRRLLAQFCHAAAFVNEDLEIVHTRGNVNRYLKLAPGRASLSILKMVREGLLFDLRNAITRAKKENVPVPKQNVRIKVGNGNGKEGSPPDASARELTRLVNFEVTPVVLGNLKELYFMIVFQDSPESRPARLRSVKAEKQSESASRKIAELEREIEATKEYLHSVIETQEAMNEELQSANEEILSTNEELQSTNEELETAKEELQSTNEELTTVNDELRSRNTEVTQVNNDLSNLLASIDIAVVMVGSDLTIRRFTPQAQEMLGLIPGDVGRPLSNINASIAIPEFQQMGLQVMPEFRSIERELVGRDGGRYQLRILPYRTADNKTDGAVITIVDLSGSIKQQKA